MKTEKNWPLLQMKFRATYINHLYCSFSCSSNRTVNLWSDKSKLWSISISHSFRNSLLIFNHWNYCEGLLLSSLITILFHSFNIFGSYSSFVIDSNHKACIRAWRIEKFDERLEQFSINFLNWSQDRWLIFLIPFIGFRELRTNETEFSSRILVLSLDFRFRRDKDGKMNAVNNF